MHSEDTRPHNEPNDIVEGNSKGNTNHKFSKKISGEKIARILLNEYAKP